MRAAFYKGTHSGLPGVYNRLVRCWTKSAYSHVELVFSTGHAASSSYMDGGVRLKVIDFDPAKWDFVELPAHLEKGAREWFEAHRGQKYDLLGNLHFVLSPVADDKRKWFCSESVAAALGLPDPWRYDPGTLASALTIMQPASAGFSFS
jgi:hypothetical protein